jgi:hypothetical protein
MKWPDQQHLQLYLQAIVAEQQLGSSVWTLPDQFSRVGKHLSFQERESLLVRVHEIFFGQGSRVLCPQRTLFVSNYLRSYLESFEPQPCLCLYPWKELADQLRKEKRTILLFGFGSLVNPESASYHLSRRRGPALAFGLKRIFNYYDEQLEQCILGRPAAGYSHERAKLNAIATEDKAHPINGILYEVDVEDLERLRPRERGYDLEKLHVVDYIDALDVHCTEPRILEAYCLRATREAQVSESYVPDINYLNVCAEGVRPYGSEFARLFLDTTYLADRTTSLEKWLLDRIYDVARSSDEIHITRYGRAAMRLGHHQHQVGNAYLRLLTGQ